MMIVTISLWAQSICAVTSNRKLLTSKLVLLVFINKKPQGTGKADVRLLRPMTNSGASLR